MDGRSHRVDARGSTGSRLLAIDLLRGLAALGVVLSHLPFSWTGGLERGGSATGGAFPPAVAAVTAYGSYGVNLFLVISGFCIHMQWARSAGASAPVRFFDFWKRRLRRLYPPYFVALACSLGGLAVITALSGSHGVGVGAMFGYASDRQFIVDVVLLVLLLQNVNGASMRVGNGPFWSLALEEQLYMLYFPFLAIRRRWGWTAALTLVLVVTFAWRVTHAFTPRPPEYWYFVGPARWLEWVLGAIAVEAHLGRIALPRWLSSPMTLAVAVAAALLVLPPHVTTDDRLWTIPGAKAIDDALVSFAAFVLVNWCCDLDRAGWFQGRRAPATLAKVGTFSYSLYLVHNPVMVLVKRIAIGMGVRNVPLLACLRLAVSVAAGYVFFRLVESFFLTKSRPPDTAPAIATTDSLQRS